MLTRIITLAVFAIAPHCHAVLVPNAFVFEVYSHAGTVVIPLDNPESRVVSLQSTAYYERASEWIPAFSLFSVVAPNAKSSMTLPYWGLTQVNHTYHFRLCYQLISNGMGKCLPVMISRK